MTNENAEGLALTEEERRILHDGVCRQHRDTVPGVYVCGPCEREGDAAVERILAVRLAAQSVPAPQECQWTTGVHVERRFCPVPAPSRGEAEVKAEALRKAREALIVGDGPALSSEDEMATTAWLDALADRILRDAQPTEGRCWR